MRFDPTTADCLIFTYKEGLLSAVAHDLQIRVAAFTITIDETTWHLEAAFDATSLRVVGVMRDGALAPNAPSDGDKRTIEQQIVRDVLHADRFPEIRFTSGTATARGDHLVVDGILALHGRERALTVSASREGSHWVADARLHQPDFGIKPYSAMLGTLRVQPDVIVRVVLPKL